MGAARAQLYTPAAPERVGEFVPLGLVWVQAISVCTLDFVRHSGISNTWGFVGFLLEPQEGFEKQSLHPPHEQRSLRRSATHPSRALPDIVGRPSGYSSPTVGSPMKSELLLKRETFAALCVASLYSLYCVFSFISLYTHGIRCVRFSDRCSRRQP